MANPILTEIDDAVSRFSMPTRRALERVTGQVPTAMGSQMDLTPIANPQPTAEPAMPVPGADVPRETPTPRLAPPPQRTTPPLVAPLSDPEQARRSEYDRLTVGPQAKSGISQIKNPVGRTALQIIGGIGDAVLPGLTMNIPGTQMHHNLEVMRARDAVNQDVAVRDAGADERYKTAQANKLATPEGEGYASNDVEFYQRDPEAWRRYNAAKNPPQSEQPNSEIELFLARNPTASVQDYWEAKRKGQPEAAQGGQVFTDDAGKVWVIHPSTGVATPVTAGLPQANAPASPDAQVPATQGVAADSGNPASTQLTGRTPAQAGQTTEEAFIAQRAKDLGHPLDANELLKARRDWASASHFESAGSGNNQNWDVLAQTIIANPSLYNQLTPTAKVKVAPILANLGFTDFGKPLSDSAIAVITDAERGIADIQDLRKKVQANPSAVGPLDGVKSLFPGTDARKMRADIDRVRQIVGKAMEGGVLRKEDEEKYKRILGSVFSEESDILYMLSEVEKDLQRGVTTLRGQQSGSGRNVPQAPDVDPRIKAYADQYFKGDVAAAQAAIAAQQKK